MEDEHVHMSHTNASTELGIFAVFDGHGGREVATFCKRHLPSALINDTRLETPGVGQALVDSFHRMDEMMRQPQHAVELGK